MSDLSNSELDRLISEAVTSITEEELGEISRIARDSEVDEIDPAEVERFIKKVRPQLAMLRAKHTFSEVLKDLHKHHLFGEIICLARQQTDSIDPAVTMVGLTLDELEQWEKNQISVVETTDIAGLVKIMNLFSIKINKLSKIIEVEEEWTFASEIKPGEVSYVLSITPSINPLSPRATNFIADLRKEVARQGLKHLDD